MIEESETTDSLDLENQAIDPVEKLTDWVNEPKLADLKADLEEAQSDHDIHVSDVEKWIANYDGKKKFKDIPNRSKIVPKTIRKQAEWRYSALSEPFLSTDDMFDVEPITYEDKDASVQNALVLNNQFNTKINKVAFIDEYVRTAVDEGSVVVKTGWEFREEEREMERPVYQFQAQATPSAQQFHQRLHQMMQTSPAQYELLEDHIKKAHELTLQGNVPIMPVDTGETETYTETVTVKNHPTIEVCEYDKVIIDPTCKGDLSKASFVIYQFETNLSELRKDGRYSNLDKIKSTSLMETDDKEFEDTTFKFKDEPRKKVTVYEYWGFYDINKTGMVEPIVAAWVGDTLIRMEENPFPDKELPFVLVQYLPERKKVYGKPDGFLLEDNQDIIGAVTRGMIDMMGRSAAGQQGVRKDALDVANARRFERGEDYQFNSNVDPRQAFHMGSFPEIPRSAMEMIQMQNMEAESMTGVKNFSQGISGQALGSTATAVRGALDAASKRELGILRRLAKGIKDIGRKMIAMNAEFLEDVEVVRITNDKFVEVKRDDLMGNFDLRLKISTAEADNEKAQELAFMLQTSQPNDDPMISKMIRVELFKLRKMPELAKRLEEYQPQPDPMSVKKAQLEIALLEAQVFNERAKAEENSVDVELKPAKTETERAKTRQLHSESDKKDLDFLEQKEGISHNRELDKQDNQARQNLDMKMLESALDPENPARLRRNL